MLCAFDILAPLTMFASDASPPQVITTVCGAKFPNAFGNVIPSMATCEGGDSRSLPHTVKTTAAKVRNRALCFLLAELLIFSHSLQSHCEHNHMYYCLCVKFRFDVKHNPSHSPTLGHSLHNFPPAVQPRTQTTELSALSTPGGRLEKPGYCVT